MELPHIIHYFKKVRLKLFAVIRNFQSIGNHVYKSNMVQEQYVLSLRSTHRQTEQGHRCHSVAFTFIFITSISHLYSIPMMCMPRIIWHSEVKSNYSDNHLPLLGEGRVSGVAPLPGMGLEWSNASEERTPRGGGRVSDPPSSERGGLRWCGSPHPYKNCNRGGTEEVAIVLRNFRYTLQARLLWQLDYIPTVCRHLWLVRQKIRKHYHMGYIATF